MNTGIELYTSIGVHAFRKKKSRMACTGSERSVGRLFFFLFEHVSMIQSIDQLFHAQYDPIGKHRLGAQSLFTEWKN